MINNKEEKIRILYIDTPEKYGGAKLEKDAKKAGISTKDEIALGELSSAYATRFFQKGDMIIIDIKKKDKYGRNLATISKNGIDYSTQIIKDGYSCIYKKAMYPKEFDNVLQGAKDNKSGLWGIDYDTMSKLCK
jgi:micrococcal nuclease